LIALALIANAAHAAPLILPEAPYSYTIIDQDLTAALHEFGSNLGIKVNVSPEVRGRIQGRLPELSPRAYLDRLSGLYNFEWYFDGLVLHVSSVREAQSRLLALSPLTFDQLRSALDVLGVSDSRYVVRPAPGYGLVLVAGPPRFVSLVEQTLAGLIAEDQARPRTMSSPRSAPALVMARDTLLTVFRGSEMTIIRNGRPERFGGPEEQRRTARNADQQNGTAVSAQ
jgi:type III secretion protein C